MIIITVIITIVLLVLSSNLSNTSTSSSYSYYYHHYYSYYYHRLPEVLPGRALQLGPELHGERGARLLRGGAEGRANRAHL